MTVHSPVADADSVPHPLASPSPAGVDDGQGRAAIRRALLAQAAVRDCVVLDRPDVAGRMRRVAYLVAAETTAERHLGLRLAELPDPGIPLDCAWISAIPLQPDGLPDEARLREIAILDESTASAWQQRIAEANPAIPSAVRLRERRTTMANLGIGLHADPAAGRIGTTLRTELAGEADAISIGMPSIQAADAPRNLAELLLSAAHLHANRGCTFIQADGAAAEISYPQLLERGQRVRAGLRDAGLRPGDSAIIVCRGNVEIVSAFWGCVLAGVIPVPVSPPGSEAIDDTNLLKLRNTLELLGNPLVIADEAECAWVPAKLATARVEPARMAAIGSLLRNDPDGEWHRPGPRDPALMLLTSGSTGRPKAVVQPHANLISQMRGSAAVMSLSHEDVSFNWFALDHVGGLIMFHVRDVMLGCKQVHAPTQLVIGDPLSWLDWLEEHRVTLSWAPNFAFGLVNRALEQNADRRWDLSSLRCLMNAGEAIVRETALRFLDNAMRFGAPAGMMRPAWGMSETCSAVTFSTLERRKPEATDDGPVEVGRPIAGVQLRIVDAEDTVLKEGQVGRLQIRGETTTPGYFGNPSATAEVFTADGWMSTGDLGYLREGSLTIAGRNKDVVIINGLNIHCHELEAVVEEVPGVSASFSAAVPVRGGDSEELAVFLHSELVASELRELLTKVRQALVSAFGVNPRYVLPIERVEFPKTAIGKLQRMPLRERLEAGGFADLIAAFGQGHRESNSVPDWFFRRDWLRKCAPEASLEAVASCALVFADDHGFAEALCPGGATRVVVKPKERFQRLAADRYELDPGCEEHYRQLLGSLAADGLSPGLVLHCWSYGERAPVAGDGSLLLAAHARGFGSLCCLLRALPGGVPVQVRVFSSGAQPIDADVAYERSTLLGLTGTVGAEFPLVDYRHVDLGTKPGAADVDHAIAELRVSQDDPEVAYRNGQRLVPALRRHGWEAVSAAGPTPLKHGGCYLITGGLGGIGLHLAGHLLKKYRARLLLLGREPLDSSRGASEGRAKKVEDLQRLQSLGGAVCYQVADVADAEALRDAIAQGERELGAAVDGVFHLAGVFANLPISEGSGNDIDLVLRAKLLGTWNLHSAFESRPEVFFVTNSSAVSLFRGAGTGAYAGANSFLEAFSLHLSARRRVHCIGWSLWDEVGMSRGLSTRALMERRGYSIMKPQQALASWELLLRGSEPFVIAGLDAGNAQVRSLLRGECDNCQEMVAFVAANPTFILPDAGVHDAYGTIVPCRSEALPATAFDARGELRADALEGLAGNHVPARRVAPIETPTQRALANIWSEILETEVVSRNDNFFELGGSSLRAAELLVAVRGRFGRRFTFATVVSKPTIAAMARLIDGESVDRSAVDRHIVPLNAQGDLPPFFGMHPLFGLVYPYAELARQLAPRQPFYALQARGFQRGERAHSSMQQLAADYCAAIRGVQPSGPYYIGGWSLGSLIALEVAQQLQQAGESVACLAIIDQATDSMERFLDETPLRTRLERFGQVLGNAMRSYDPVFARHRGFLGPVRAPLRFLRFLDAVFVPMLKVAWACNKIARDYVIRPYQGRITLLHTDDPELTHIEDPRWGWDRVARDGVDVYRISGDHFNLHEYPHVGRLASQLREALAACRSAAG